MDATKLARKEDERKCIGDKKKRRHGGGREREQDKNTKGREGERQTTRGSTKKEVRKACS